jgi:hypothetical protein
LRLFSQMIPALGSHATPHSDGSLHDACGYLEKS